MGNITNTVLTSKDQGLAKERQKNARDNIGAMAKVTGTVNDVLVVGPGGEAKDSGFYLDPGGFIVRQADWEEEDQESPAYIKHKPDLDGYATKEEVATKAEKDYVDLALLGKADKGYVDVKIADVSTELAKKVEKDYVDIALTGKADKGYVDIELAKKVDAVPGYGLSQNDLTDSLKSSIVSNTAARHTHGNKAVLDATTAAYTVAEKEKLAGISSKPASEGGLELSLVTTGDKFRWNEKQDRIDYYLADAEIVSESDTDTLVILKSDGTEVTFTGGGSYFTISADGDQLVPTGNNVDIPLAEPGESGQSGNAGLVRGSVMEFSL